ncbi:MAG: retropepsin-like aspartic protease [Thermodesulfobacteriota bacterium]
MPNKNFEQVVRFYELQSVPAGPSIWLPLVDVTLITQAGSRINLPLLFDTGASVTTLRAEFYSILGLQSWDQGQKVQTSTAGGVKDVYQYVTTLEVFGKTITCPIQLNDQLPSNPLFMGLLGRDTVFNEFGFGFWENTHELYVTENP